MTYFTHGIEVNNFEDLMIRNFKGIASPVNLKAFPIFLQDRIQTNIDTKNGVKRINVKK
jgi:hypothetical protein